MPILRLSNDQVVELVKQLPTEQQAEIFKLLLIQQWGVWESLTQYGANQARLVAQERGYDWDKMTEEEREVFIDNVIHKD